MWRLDGDIYNIYNSICSNKNNRHEKVYRLLNYKQRGCQHNLLLKSLNQQNYMYQLGDQNLQKDFHLNLNWGKNGTKVGIIYWRIWKSYDIDKYTKVCGGGSYRSDENK